MNRIIIEGENSNFIDIGDLPLLKDRENIIRVWSIYDESEVLENAKFNPHTGEEVTGLENAYLEHLKGVFLEDYVHDWKIVDDEFHIYSRTRAKGDVIRLIVECR